MNATKGYIFLEPQHPIVEDLIRDKLLAYHEPNSKGEKGLEPLDVKIADFDGVFYKILVNKDKPNIMQVNLFMSVLKDIKPAGGDATITSEYGAYKASTAQNSDLTLELDASRISATEVEPLSVKLGLLKRNLLAAPFKRAFDALLASNSASLAPTVLQVRDKEQIVIAPAADRVNVAFSVDFSNETDAALADVFMSTFSDAGRAQSNAPNVKYSRDVPSEMRSIARIQTHQTTVGWLMFTVTTGHINTPELSEKVITLLLDMRHYLHYHIKASKAHLHTRMRAKVRDFLLVLNRARPEGPERAKINYRVINF